MAKKQSYAEQINSPKWQKKRLQILNLRGFRCEECGDEEQQLHIHHRFYIKGREIWEYDNDVFQVLCKKCHNKTHEKSADTISVTIIEKQLLTDIREMAGGDCEFMDSFILFFDKLKTDVFASCLFRDIVSIMTIGNITNFSSTIKELANLYECYNNEIFENQRLKKIIDDMNNKITEPDK